jgi:glycosyltransferase involved in cell wall biosynthesis
VREKDVKKFSRPNVKIKFYPYSDYKKYLPGAYNEILGTATLAREHLDIIHTTSPMSRIPMTYHGKTVVTFHDLAVYKIPEVFPKVKRTRDRTIMSLMAGKANKIIAVSDSTKKDICDIFGCHESKVSVIYSGFDKRMTEESRSPREKVLEHYGINEGKKYILFLGTLEPVKNITKLLEAFKLFKEKCKKDGGKCEHKLVMAGKNGWLADGYKALAKELGIDKDVIFTGYIVGDELVPLFKNADFFVMPSLYEGFGTTVLEAFATGTPVIASNVSSIPAQEIADAMFEFASDENMKNEYREKGKKQVEKFNWEKTARETLEIYNSLMKN